MIIQSDVLRLEASETGLYFNLRARQSGYATDTGKMIHKFGDGSIKKYLSEELVAAYGGATGVQGPQGVKGDYGDQGMIGVTGLVGITGIRGVTGAQGLTGAQGYTGARGVTGTGGLGPMGYTGVQGLTGAQGLQGAQGPQGVQGAQGVQGPQGATGAQGLQGPQGTAGTNGSTGATGLQGPQGVQGPQGNQGNQGDQGSQGPQGIQGATGAQGVQGYTGLRGDVGNAFAGAYGDSMVITTVGQGVYWTLRQQDGFNITYVSGFEPTYSSTYWTGLYRCQREGYYYVKYTARLGHTSESAAAVRMRLTLYRPGEFTTYLFENTVYPTLTSDQSKQIYGGGIVYLEVDDTLTVNIGDTTNNVTTVYVYGLDYTILPIRLIY